MKVKNSKSKDTRPARARYWASKRLEGRKLKNIMRYMGLSRIDALYFWRDSRGGRRMPGAPPKKVDAAAVTG